MQENDGLKVEADESKSESLSADILELYKEFGMWEMKEFTNRDTVNS